jgi:hypothetical protein
LRFTPKSSSSRFPIFENKASSCAGIAPHRKSALSFSEITPRLRFLPNAGDRRRDSFEKKVFRNSDKFAPLRNTAIYTMASSMPDAAVAAERGKFK